MLEIIKIFWFFLPAGIANMTPIFFAKLPYLKKYEYPLDFYQKFRGKRVFGDHKTIRGLISGTIAAIIVVYLQKLFSLPSFVDYQTVNPVILGTLLGAGALIGDAIKSFFKRQLNIPSGKPFIPFDQIDYILGAIVFTFFYVRLSLWDYLFSILLFLVLHLLISYLGYLLKLKKDPI